MTIKLMWESWVLANKTNRDRFGFTIPELVVGITVAAVLFLAILSVLTNYLVLTTRNNVRIDMTASSQALLRATVDALRLGDGVRQTNSISDPNAPNGGWNTNNTSFVIVIETPAYDSARNFIIDSTTGNPYMNELVYYKNGSQLLRRNLANPDAAGDTLKTSCPANLATDSCPADAVLSNYVQSITFTFYDQDDVTTTDPLLARSINIQLVTQRTIFGESISLTNNIRVTLRNKF